MSSNGSPGLILPDGSLAEDVLNYTKLIDAVEAPLISENDTLDMDSTSSLVQTPEYFENDECFKYYSFVFSCPTFSPKTPTKST